MDHKELSMDELAEATGGKGPVFDNCRLYQKLVELMNEEKPTDEFISEKLLLCKVQSAIGYSTCGARCPLWNAWH